MMRPTRRLLVSPERFLDKPGCAAAAPRLRRSYTSLVLAPRVVVFHCALSAVACGAAPQQTETAAAVIDVEPAPITAKIDDTAPPAAVRPPPPEPDPLGYYLGWWDGVVNETEQTLLYVGPDGRWQVQSTPARGDACRMAGRLRIEPQTLHLHVDFNTCNPDHSEPVLERAIVSRSDNEFSLQSPDERLFFRYTRRERH